MQTADSVFRKPLELTLEKAMAYLLSLDQAPVAATVDLATLRSGSEGRSRTKDSLRTSGIRPRARRERRPSGSAGGGSWPGDWRLSSRSSIRRLARLDMGPEQLSPLLWTSGRGSGGSSRQMAKGNLRSSRACQLRARDRLPDGACHMSRGRSTRASGETRLGCREARAVRCAAHPYRDQRQAA